MEEGDLIQVDIPGRVLRICGIHGKEATEEEIAAELARRKERWQPRPPKYTGALGLFTRNAASPMKGGSMDLDAEKGRVSLWQMWNRFCGTQA